ncbi:Uncharacterised protein [uncultured archaeon]|nr:Uncharacterised protein [uncultured archaeon]
MRVILILAIFFLAISGVYGAAYPGGFFRGPVDMMGYEITNASNLMTYGDLANYDAQNRQDLSDIQNYTDILSGVDNDLSAGIGATNDRINNLTEKLNGIGYMQTFQAFIPGDIAGNHTIMAITATDFLQSVYSLKVTEGALVVTDLTSEFRPNGNFGILTDGLISNAGGSDSTGAELLVTWESRYMVSVPQDEEPS